MIDAATFNRIFAEATETETSPFSMLSDGAQALIRMLARESKGPVVEVGTYVGGTTIEITKGLAEAGGGRLISIEVGGSHPTHYQMPSNDILADWHKNTTLHAAFRSELIVGYSWSTGVIDELRRSLAGEKIRLLVIDADGFPGLTLVDFAEFISQDCLIVIDDYLSPEDAADSKPLTTKRQVDRAVERGELETLGVYPWGTWFGCLRRPVSSYVLGLVFALPRGKGFVERVPVSAMGWHLKDDVGTEYIAATVDEVLDAGNCRFSIEASDGAFLYFAPPGELKAPSGQFELFKL